MNDKNQFSWIDRFKMNPEETAIVSDVDGVLSRISETPADAKVEPKVAKLLDKLQRKYQAVALISGRSAKQARAMVGNKRIIYIGNHGMEWLVDDEIRISDKAKRYQDDVRGALDESRRSEALKIPGVIIEDKGITFSVHYRMVQDKNKAKQKIDEFLKRLAETYSIKITYGRSVFEVRPPVEVNKGSAISDLVKWVRVRKLIYLGDDATDVDAFLEIRKLRDNGSIEGLAIGVESEETPKRLIESADQILKGTNEVEGLLAWLAS